MNAGDISRQKDYIYRLLVSKNNLDELNKCSKSVLTNYVTQHSSCHPTLASLATHILDDTKTEKIVMQRALILFCMHVENSFVQYLMDRDDVDNVCVSQFVCQDLPKCTKKLLDGVFGIDDFVANATADYICG